MGNHQDVLQITGLSKSFGVTRANINIDFNLKKGEIRGLAGENGSGKSTLLSQIAGIYESDSGTMYKDGEVYQPKSPLDANERKISMVVQELGLVGNLPAGINVFLGKTKQFATFGVVSLSKVYASSNAELKKWGLPPIKFQKLAGEMNVESRKMVELARALASDPDILILDEVTQALSHDNRTVLYQLIKKFKELGRSIILITHDLEEMIQITDSISILRDGKLIATEESQNLNVDVLKAKMVGRELEGEYYRSDMEELYEDDIILSVENLSIEGGVNNISFEIHKGEILGFCGLSDSGIHDVGKAVYGVEKIKSGTIRLIPENVEIKNSEQALAHRMAYVPKDRDGEALMMQCSIEHNFCLTSVENIKGRLGYLSGKRMKKMAEEAKEKFNVKCTCIDQTMSGLSGGNKQKVNLGRWLIKDLQVLIIDCPTRGVDVGVKAYIYECLKVAKNNGLAVLLITDELSEAIGMSDNIVIMKNGVIKKTIKRSAHFSEEEIIEVMI